MLKPNEIEGLPTKVVALYERINEDIMNDIVKRIAKTGTITATTDTQIWRLTQLSQHADTVKDTIKHTLKLSDAQTDKLFNDATELSYVRDKSIYRSTGTEYVPFNKNKEVKQMISAITLQTNNEIANITKSLGFSIVKNGKTIYNNEREYFTSKLDETLMQITSGTFDYNNAIKSTVNEMVRSGLRTVDYATGAYNRTEVAVRRAVMTGIGQITGKISDSNAETLGTDKFEVSAHSGAREDHQSWQGKVYTKAQLESICGLGTGSGLKGWNCRHDYFPFVDVASERAYTDTQLNEMAKEENTPKAYNGKDYTTYEATQRQRQMETTMRAQRQQIAQFKLGNVAEEDVIKARAKYKATSAQYADFSKHMRLVQQRERITIDGLGRI